MKKKNYRVVRIVIEKYYVVASSKEEAAQICCDPYEVTVKSEKVTLEK